MSLYTEPISWQGSLSELYQITSKVVDVLSRYNFKKADESRLVGIAKIVTEGKDIIPDNGGFLDMDISEILRQMANGGELVLDHRNNWYAISGNYRKPSEVLQQPSTFTATIKVDGNKGSKKANISVEIWYEISYQDGERKSEVEEEITLVFKGIKEIKL